MSRDFRLFLLALIGGLLILHGGGMHDVTQMAFGCCVLLIAIVMVVRGPTL